jgi:hypothetical protein
MIPKPPLAFDPRMTPLREGSAARSLEGEVEATRFVEPEPARIRAATAALRRNPDPQGPLDTELLHGEMVDVYGRAGGWVWGQARRDGYVGYLAAADLWPVEPSPTHRIRDLRAFIYPGPSIKATPIGHLPFGAECAVLGEEARFARIEAGYVFLEHLGPLEDKEADPVAVAERLIGIPYLWGGKSSLGLDCSGLVQTACHACGISALRDSDMQEQTLGQAINIPDDPSLFDRGDLLFWEGHVGFSQGEGRLLHATGAFMKVVSEPLGLAIKRIAEQGHRLRTVRRLSKA